MSWASVLVVAGFTWLGVLLLALHLPRRLDWRIKAGAIVITSAFFVASYYAWQRVGGWPTEARLPDEFQLLAYDIREPDKRTGEDGRIVIWVRGLGERSADPRAYRLSYERDLHRKLREAGESLRRGIAQRGERSVDGAASASGAPGESGINFFPHVTPRPPKSSAQPG